MSSSVGPGRSMTSLSRGLRVLAALADEGPMRADAIADSTGLPISTVYRYLREFVSFGFLEARQGAYVAGSRLSQMVQVNGAADRLAQAGARVLATLAERSGETAMLTVRVGCSALVLDRVESAQAIRLSFQRGAVRPLYAGASAKVLLAFAPSAVVEAVLRGGELRPLTDHTPDRVALRRQLNRIRAQRCAITFGESDAHAVGIAVPVFRGRACVCGLSIAGPEQRFRPEHLDELARLVRGAGDQLSTQLTAGSPADQDPLASIAGL